MLEVMTVSGSVAAAELGVTHLHEHLLSDFRCYLPEADADRDRSPITLGDYHRHRYDAATEHNLTLGDPGEALAEVAAFAAAGGGTVVDSTSIGIGRDPVGLRGLAEQSEINIVMGAGWYVHNSLPPGFDLRPVEDLAEEIERDLTDGVADTGVVAGFIGEVGLSWPHHHLEMRSLDAACRAQVRTGVMLQIHPGRDRQSPLEAVKFCIGAGVDPARVVVSHVERTLTDLGSMFDLARLGCVLEFDLFGQESSYYFDPAFTDMPNDAGRIRSLLALADAGFSDQIAVSQDLCQRTHTTAYGGEGLDHILTRAVPLMRTLDADEEFIEQLLIRTPARVLGVDR